MSSFFFDQRNILNQNDNDDGGGTSDYPFSRLDASTAPTAANDAGEGFVVDLGGCSGRCCIYLCR